MADTTTPNYALVKPEPGASDETWGIKLNSDLDIIDAKIKLAVDNAAAALAAANNAQQVGIIYIIGGAAALTGTLLCDGAAYNRVGTYAALFAKIGIAFGAGDGVNTFNVPNLRGAFLRGTDYGRGLDPARVIGSYQADDYKSHNHDIAAGTGTHKHAPTIGTSGGTHDHGSISTSQPVSSPTHSHAYTRYASLGSADVGPYSGVWVGTASVESGADTIPHTHTVDLPTGGAHGHTITWPTTADGGHDHTITNSPTTGGLETRPKNVAVNFCIKY
jgi:microcystin-dependent protein